MKIAFALASSLVVAVAACSPAGASDASPQTTTTTTTPAKPAVAAVAATVPTGPLGVVLQGYEELRRDLAADQVTTLPAIAARIQAAALQLQTEKKPAAEDLVKGAQALTALGATPDMKQARVAYGELSRGVVGAVAAEPALQAGRFLFECPMAKGYQRWVQLEEKMANPYMGKRMLECGTAVPAWKVEG